MGPTTRCPPRVPDHPFPIFGFTFGHGRRPLSELNLFQNTGLIPVFDRADPRVVPTWTKIYVVESWVSSRKPGGKGGCSVVLGVQRPESLGTLRRAPRVISGGPSGSKDSSQTLDCYYHSSRAHWRLTRNVVRPSGPGYR